MGGKWYFALNMDQVGPKMVPRKRAKNSVLYQKCFFVCGNFVLGNIRLGVW